MLALLFSGCGPSCRGRKGSCGLGARLCSSALGSCVMLGELLSLLELVNLICEVVIKVSVSELSAQQWQMSAGMFIVK